MGIISLHSFLNNNPAKRKCRIDVFKNKKICIDIYNYIYKYLATGKLIPQLEKMCKIFHKYNIQCLFVFDGKYDKIKINTQKDRQKKREKAEKKFGIDVVMTPWIILSSDKKIIIPVDTLMTIVEPIDGVKKMFLDKNEQFKIEENLNG